MKKYIILLAIALSGCVSTQSALNEAPKEVVQSKKSQLDVAFCLANKNNVSALDAPDGAKVIQIKNGYGAVGTIFSVYQEGDGSRIEIRKPINVGFMTHRQCY